MVDSKLITNVRELRKQKYTIRQIAAQLGISKSQVQRIVSLPSVSEQVKRTNELIEQLTLSMQAMNYKILIVGMAHTGKSTFASKLIEGLRAVLVSNKDVDVRNVTLNELTALEDRAEAIKTSLVVIRRGKSIYLANDSFNEFDVVLECKSIYDSVNRRYVPVLAEVA